jgi:hypothetical protein
MSPLRGAAAHYRLAAVMAFAGAVARRKSVSSPGQQSSGPPGKIGSRYLPLIQHDERASPFDRSLNRLGYRQVT